MRSFPEKLSVKIPDLHLDVVSLYWQPYNLAARLTFQV